MLRRATNFSLHALAGWLTLSLWIASGWAAGPAKVDFAHDLVPLLRTRCAECHTDGTYKGSFSLDTRGDARIEGRSCRAEPDESELVGASRVRRSGRCACHPRRRSRSRRRRDRGPAAVDCRRGRMAGRVTRSRRTRMSAAASAARVKLPPAKPGLEHPIDRFLDAYYASHGSRPPRSWTTRRSCAGLYLDGIGLLPAPGGAREPLKHIDLRQARSSSMRHRARRPAGLRRSLADFWNDLLRNDYAGHRLHRRRPQADHRLALSSLLDNKPYDQFVRELISPDGGIGGLHQGHQVARQRQRQPGAARFSSPRTCRRCSSAST